MSSSRARAFRLVSSFATLVCAACAQIPDSPPAVVADIPVNYTEASTGTYTLPDPLKLNSGQRVTSANTWFGKRRLEIRKLIEQNWFGRAPSRPRDMTFEVF